MLSIKDRFNKTKNPNALIKSKNCKCRDLAFDPKASQPNVASSPRKARLPSQHIPSEIFGSLTKISWPIIVISPRKVHSSSQQNRSEVSDFPTAIAFSRHCGGL